MVKGKFLRPDENLQDLFALRRAVFVDEQGFPASYAADDIDPISQHVALFDETDPAGNPTAPPVATGRIYWQDGEFRLGRICVRKDKRGQNLGDLLMRMLLYKAKEHNATAVSLGAQQHAVPFYARYGFVPIEEYHDDGVLHTRMRATHAQINLEGTCHRVNAPDACPGCIKKEDSTHA